MIEFFSTEFWIAILFGINFFLVVFLFLVIKRVNRMDLVEPDQSHDDEDLKNAKHASGTASDIIGMLAPLVEESRKAAISFDDLVKEKKRLLKELNDALDSRIISINLLLSRADASQKRMQEKQTRVNQPLPISDSANVNVSSNAVLDQQNQIIELYNQHLEIDTIAEKLSVPKGEVQLVIELKKKFIAMEKNYR